MTGASGSLRVWVSTIDPSTMSYGHAFPIDADGPYTQRDPQFDGGPMDGGGFVLGAVWGESGGGLRRLRYAISETGPSGLRENHGFVEDSTLFSDFADIAWDGTRFHAVWQRLGQVWYTTIERESASGLAVESIPDWNIRPNPATDAFVLDFDRPLDRMELRSIDGRLLLFWEEPTAGPYDLAGIAAGQLSRARVCATATAEPGASSSWTNHAGLTWELALAAALLGGGSDPDGSREEHRPGDAANPEPWELVRVEGEFTLDAFGNELFWSDVDPLPLTTHTPEFGHDPSEPTEIRVAYDEDNVYVYARLLTTDASSIRSPSRQRDELGLNNDWIGVIFDSFNDNENGLCFFTTPAGLRLDMAVFNDAEGDFPLNVSWNTFWDVATRQDDAGWYAEMRIPLSSLRFQVVDGKVEMGMIAWRWIAQRNETDIFPTDLSQEVGGWSAFKPSRARKVVLRGVRARRPVYFAPYVLGGFGQVWDLNDPETAYERSDDPVYEAGGDLKLSLTSNLTLDLTVNTDFAQVEADDAQVNLTRFSLFFPEKRLFFQERSSIFEVSMGPNQVFYSRRIGLRDGEPTRIYGGPA